MKPLSIFKYYKSNRKKFLAVFTAVLLGVFLLYMVQMLIASTYQSSYRAFVEPKKYYSSISAKGKLLDNDILGRIKNFDAVEMTMPCIYHISNFNSRIAETSSTRVYALLAGDLEVLMERMGLKCIKGKIPAPGTHEIIMHKFLAENKNLKIGDKVGSYVDKGEKLTGEYTLAGIMDGGPMISFTSLETYMKDYNITDASKYTTVILPKAGRIDALNKYLDTFPPSSFEVSTYNSVRKNYEGTMESISLLLTCVSIIVIVIVSICVGFLFYIYFSQRRSEFGLLSAIGYTEQQVINRAFFEISGINIAGYCFGVILSIFTSLLLDQFVFQPKGQPLKLWAWDYFLIAFCVPLFVTLFSIVPVWRMLRKLDPISIIEGVM